MAWERCLQANISAIGKDGQQKLSSSTFAIAGLGGVGGIAFELLVRAGAREIRIADGDFFEEQNANRQSMWSRKTEGRSKTQVAKMFAREVNPRCKIPVFSRITAENTLRFSKGCVATIDATDTPHSRMCIWGGCRESRTPYIFASAKGARGLLSVVPPGRSRLPCFFAKRPGAASCDHALGPVANAIGCLAAQQAINTALGKPIVAYPGFFSLDAFSRKPAACAVF